MIFQTSETAHYSSQGSVPIFEAKNGGLGDCSRKFEKFTLFRRLTKIEHADYSDFEDQFSKNRYEVFGKIVNNIQSA